MGRSGLMTGRTPNGKTRGAHRLIAWVTAVCKPCGDPTSRQFASHTTGRSRIRIWMCPASERESHEPAVMKIADDKRSQVHRFSLTVCPKPLKCCFGRISASDEGRDRPDPHLPTRAVYPLRVRRSTCGRTLHSRLANRALNPAAAITLLVLLIS